MNAYWAQWSRAELNDMLGVEERAYHQDDDHDDSNEMIEEEVCCSGCMDCLGMSWRDFF